jgi:hypothetical protein
MRNRRGESLTKINFGPPEIFQAEITHWLMTGRKAIDADVAGGLNNRKNREIHDFRLLDQNETNQSPGSQLR